MSLKRRGFLAGAAAWPLLHCGSLPSSFPDSNPVVNDVQTGLNPTRVERILRPASIDELQDLVRDCARRNKPICTSGSRHATGGQQFAEDATLIDMRKLARVIDLDSRGGILQAEAGVEWPELVQGYLRLQPESAVWGIRQKQGGADRMSVGGALAANAHGHGLGIPPIASDVEWFDILTADGALQRCHRKRNQELFSLAIGGYGLFGIIVSVGLRLTRRRKLRRRVETRTLPEAMRLVDSRTKAGSPYGYFQYSISGTSPDFLRSGILTTYEAAPDNSQVTESTDAGEVALQYLLELAHSDPEAAYRKYATLELQRDGNVEWSDLHQLSSYPAGYHQKIDSHRPDQAGTDLILEVYVPRNQLISFAEDARYQLLKAGIPLVYGTIRFIEKDQDSFLAWAKKSYACAIFTPHVAADPMEMQKAQRLCRRLEQSAIRRGGSFYLTYNRFATRSELDSAYPQFSAFLALKRRYDPSELFQSEWYRFYKKSYA